ncbi:MAG: phage holin family protein [Parvibaculaceae bacterium]
MANITAKIKRLAEVELLRAEIKARRAARRAAIFSVGVFAGAIAFFFLTYGTFLWGAERYGAINTAFVMGGVLFAIATAAIVFAMLAPRRTDEIEGEFLARAIAEARDDLRDDLDALEDRFDKVSNRLGKLLDGPKAADGSSSGFSLATAILVLSAIGAASPTLNRYIQPILKILT